VEANPRRVNDRDMSGITPLYIPVHHKKSLPQILWLLDKNGADVNTTTSIGWSALHLASSFDILDVLLDRGADPTLQSQGWSPLMQQVHSRNFNLVARLLQEPRVRAAINCRSGSGSTALHYACGIEDELSNLLIIRLLLRVGADSGITNKD